MNKKTLSPEDDRHGTENGYNNYGCRCVPCRTAHTTYTREVLTPNRLARPIDPMDERHGTVNLYDNYGCRCVPCTRANRDRGRKSRNRYVGWAGYDTCDTCYVPEGVVCQDQRTGFGVDKKYPHKGRRRLLWMR